MTSSTPDDDTATIDHQPGCAAGHTDPADSCYSPPITIGGLSVHLDLTHRTAHSPQVPGATWTAETCTTLSGMFGQLSASLLQIG